MLHAYWIQNLLTIKPDKVRRVQFAVNMLQEFDDEPELRNGELAEINPSHGQQETPI